MITENAVYIYIALLLAGLTLGWTIRWLYARFQKQAAEQTAAVIKDEAEKDAEARTKEMLLEAKEKIISERREAEREIRERRAEVQRLEHRVIQKEDSLEKKLKQTDRLEQQLVERGKAFTAKEEAFAGREEAFAEKERELARSEERYLEELSRVASLTREAAKEQLIEGLRNEAIHDAQTIINKVESEANLTAEKKARSILATVIQRLASDITGEMTITSVAIPEEEMKGRIIGREGRNIRALETVAGVDIIIDDTPEAVVISCFDPVRREIGKMALERLVVDGRIHPARNEEVVGKVSREVSQRIFEEGERILYDLGIHNMGREAINLLGRLYFRTSYGQNVLTHSREVAQLASLLAAELGANRDLAKRGALLHDIGKGVETDSDLNHAEIGMDMARKLGENAQIINMIGAHHGDIEPTCVEAVIVQIADAISAARPGARKETLENYVKRLKSLEDIANSFRGVEKAFAIQAGRELRVIVHNDQVNDEQAREVAREVAKKIETDLRYPGRIKLTVIRETRIVEYAR
jgi:ribonuclease Y